MDSEDVYALHNKELSSYKHSRWRNASKL
jgi:hypothetical protein